MKIYQHTIILWALALLSFGACNEATSISSSPSIALVTAVDSVPSKDSIPLGLQKLIAAYPNQNLRATSNQLIWEDGFSLVYQDHKTNKSFEELLNQPDLEDQMAMKYPKGKDYAIPNRNEDPGRMRVEAFFLKMYGKNKEEVRKQLTEIDFLGAKLLVTKVNNIDQKLQTIAHELGKHPALKKYLDNVGGTFNWRKIAGTNRLSTHSFGMTIDINVKYSNYWRWAVKDKTENGKRPIVYKNQIPLEIVQIFENNGFIWGGKWYHYDTMHFEYRPELLIEL